MIENCGVVIHETTFTRLLNAVLNKFQQNYAITHGITICVISVKKLYFEELEEKSHIF